MTNLVIVYTRGKIISSFDGTRATALTNGDFSHLTKTEITITRPSQIDSCDEDN